jgi:hypothetical protein
MPHGYSFCEDLHTVEVTGSNLGYKSWVADRSQRTRYLSVSNLH